MRQADISRLLPEVFQRTIKPETPLAAILSVMEGLHEPAEQVIETLADNFSVYRASDPFVILLAHYLDLDRYLAQVDMDGYEADDLLPSIASGMGRLRQLIGCAPELSRWRGTGWGLRSFLETATGLSGFEIREKVLDDEGDPLPFHIQVVAPASALVYQDLVRQIVEQEKPAYVTHDIIFNQDGKS